MPGLWVGAGTDRMAPDKTLRGTPTDPGVSRHERKMPGRRSSLTIALAIGLVVGLAYPFVDLGLACRAPASEACVWGKAYLPLTLGVSVVLLGGVAAALVYAVLMRKRRARSGDDAV